MKTERCPVCGWVVERIESPYITGTAAAVSSHYRPLSIDAATLAAADASLEVLEAEEKEVAVWEQSPAAMVHHGERWLAEAKAARGELGMAIARLHLAALALRQARSTAINAINEKGVNANNDDQRPGDAP